MGRWVSRWVLAACALAPAADAPEVSAADEPPPRFLASPRYLLTLPDAATDDDVKGAADVLRTLERLAAALDREFVAAGVVKVSDVPKPDAAKRFEAQGPEALAEPPKGPARWTVRFARTREELAAVLEPQKMTVNTQGTAFYCTGPASLLGVVAGAGLPDLLGWGSQQALHQRAGLWFSRPARSRGACVPLGFTHFMRWSHVPAGADFPRELGGIDAKYAEKLRAALRASDPSFPSLERLFLATPNDFDTGGTALHGPAVLLAEFLWEDSPASRKRYLAALATYGASGRPVAEFPLATLLKSVRPLWKDQAAFEAAFREYVLERSAAVNERKAGAK